MNPNNTPRADGMALDPKVVKVMKAIRQIESSGNYEAIGDNGTSAGAFQWNNGKDKVTPGQAPKNYWGHAKEAGVDVKDFSKASQNKVAYSIMKKWKDEGLDPEEIAAKWNGAKRGANGKLTYVAPEYGEKFRTALFGGQQQSGQAAPIGPTQFQTTVPRETPEQGGVLSQLGTNKIEPPKEPSQLDYRLNQGSQALGKLSTGVAEGDISDIASGTLQTAGALAGGVVDATDAALGLIPGYDASMDFIGKKILAPLIKKGGGESFYKGWQEFATEHPDAAKNIGAMGNIASVIPIFKSVKIGMGATADAMRTGVAKTGFVKSVEDAAKNELNQSLGTNLKGKKFAESSNIKGTITNPVDTIVDRDYLPNVQKRADGIPEYNTTEAMEKAEKSIEDASNLMDRDLQEAMKIPLSATGGKLKTMSDDATRYGYYPINSMRKDVEREIEKRFKANLNVPEAQAKANNLLKSLEGSYGNYVPLTSLREIKTGVREGVKYSTDVNQSLDKEVRKVMGRVYMDKIEEMAKDRGFKNISDLAGRMQADYDAYDALKFLNGRSVVENPGFRGMLGRKGGDVATIAGEAVGQTVGVPGAGAFLGKTISNRAISGSGKSVVGKLKSKRTRKRPSKALLGATLGVLQTRHFQEDQPEKK